MNLKKVKYLTYGLMAFIILMAFLCVLTKSPVFLWLMLVFALVTLYVETTLGRCPNCGKPLGHLANKFCPHCGKELDDLK